MWQLSRPGLSGADFVAESKCQVCIVGCPRTATQVFTTVYWSSNTALWPRILWLYQYIDVKRPLLGFRQRISLRFLSLWRLFSLLQKVNKNTSKPSRITLSLIYTLLIRSWILFLGSPVLISHPIRDYYLSLIHYARSSVRILCGSNSQSKGGTIWYSLSWGNRACFVIF